MQRELLDRRPHWASRRVLASAIFEWIEAWYNPRRRHTSIENRSRRCGMISTSKLSGKPGQAQVRRFATLRGLAGALQTPVGVVAPFLAGWMFDRHGNYQLIFTIYGLIATTGAIWVMLIRRPLWVDPDRS